MRNFFDKVLGNGAPLKRRHIKSKKLVFMDNELNQIKLTHDIQIITKKYS